MAAKRVKQPSNATPKRKRASPEPEDEPSSSSESNVGIEDLDDADADAPRASRWEDEEDALDDNQSGSEDDTQDPEVRMIREPCAKS